MLRTTTRSFLRAIDKPCFLIYRRNTPSFQRPSWSAFANIQPCLSLRTPFSSFGESERGYHESSTPFAAQESIINSEPLTTSHLEEEDDDNDIPDVEEIMDQFDETEGAMATLQVNDAEEDVLREDPKSLPDAETYRQRRQKLHFDWLLERTPVELLREAHRLATFPSSLYCRSVPGKLPSGEDPQLHASKPISFPMIYHAVKIVHALGHGVTLAQTDGVVQQRHLLQEIFRLVDRLVREEAAYSPQSSSPQIHKKVARLIQTSHIMAPGLLSPSCLLNMVVLRWKDLSLAARQAEESSSNHSMPPIWSPKELLSQLQSWSSLLTASSHPGGASSRRVQLYDMVIINMILEVILKTQPDPAEAPLVAERLLQFLLASQPEQERVRLRPDSFTYGLILSAWSQSKLPQAGLRMEALVQEMKEQHGVAPTAVTYLILLRFYASQGNPERLQAVLQQMKENLPDDCAHNIQVLSEVVFCHCQTGNLPEASATLDQMLRQTEVDPTLDARARDITIESIFNLLTSYREAILSSKAPREAIRFYTSEAERLVRAVQRHAFIFPRDTTSQHRILQEQLDNTLSFIYASAGRLDVVETMFENNPYPSYLRYLALVEAYGQHRLPEQATKVLYRLLDHSPHISSFNSHIFSAVMDAWDTAGHPRALEHALDIMALVELHPRCVEFQVRPCAAVFNTLLQILSNLTTANATTVTIPAIPAFLEAQALQDAIVDVPKAPLDDQHDARIRTDATAGIALDTCRFSIAILDEMERRYRKYGVGKPTNITYSIIIKTCFRANELKVADQIMKRMELSDTPPNIRTYNNILSHYSSLQSTAGAEQAEKILLYLREHGREKPHLRPDIISYSILLKAWAGSGDPRTLEHMWHIHEIVRSEGIEMDLVFGMHLISSLSSPPVEGQPPESAESDASSSSDSSMWLQRALHVLEEMEASNSLTKKPDLRAYKLLLDGYIRSRDLVAATSLVLHMVEVYTNGKNPHAKPDQQIFLQMTESWIKYGDLVKATMFANKMRELYLLRQIPIGPGLGCYRMLQFAWQRSTHPKKDMFIANVQSHIEDFEDTRRSEKRFHQGLSPVASSASPTFLEVANAAAATQLHHL